MASKGGTPSSLQLEQPVVYVKAPKTTISQGSYYTLVSWPKTRGIPEIMSCTILLPEKSQMGRGGAQALSLLVIRAFPNPGLSMDPKMIGLFSKGHPQKYDPQFAETAVCSVRSAISDSDAVRMRCIVSMLESSERRCLAWKIQAKHPGL